MAPRINKNQRYILIDTNLISRFSNKDLGEKILAILQEAVGYGYGLAISDFTYYELLNEAPLEKEAEMIGVLNGVTRFFVKKDILIGAGHMGSFYKEHGLPPDQFDDGDKIIAATSVLHNCVIFTLNGRDFPQPFFKELDRRMIDYQNKEWPVCVPAYFLEPQLTYIGSYHLKRNEPYLAKMKATTTKPPTAQKASS